jgi:hypothetical protein
MFFLRKSIITFGLITLSLAACSKVAETQASATETEAIVPTVQTEVVLPTPTSQIESIDISTSIPDGYDYSACGSGDLIDVGYYFLDNDGNISPTQLVRFKKTSDEVRDYVAVITCLKHNEGWISDPNEVEDGYENEIIFFDKNGKAHTYRIIIGGHYIEPYDPTHRDITASKNGIDDYYYYVLDWIDNTRTHFNANGSRQIGLDIYLDDTQGDLSKVLKQVYKFRETNWQIFNALQTGEGYPKEVPDGFFLFATYSWLIEPE